MKKLILIFVLFLLIMPMALGINFLGIDGFIWADFGDAQLNNSRIIAPANGSTVLTQGWTDPFGGEWTYGTFNGQSGNLSILSPSSDGESGYNWRLGDIGNVTFECVFLDDSSDTSGSWNVNTRNAAGTNLDFVIGIDTGVTTTNYIWRPDGGANRDTGVARRDDGIPFAFSTNLALDNISLFIDGLFIGSKNPSGFGEFKTFGASSTLAVALDNCSLWNGTLADKPQALAPPDQNLKTFTLTAADLYDSAALSNISFTIANSSFSFNDSTLNGTFVVLNSSVPSFETFYDITFRSNDTGGYIDRTFVNINLTDTGSFQGDLFQAILRINATEVITNTTITSFDVSVPLQSNTSNSSGFSTLFLRAGNYNISINAAGWMTTSANFSINNLEDNTLTMFMGTSNLTITAVTGAITINDFNTTMILLSTGFTETRETNNGKVIFPTIIGTFNVTINSTAFAFAHQVITITADNLLPNITFSLLSRNSINISIFDEESNTLLDSITTTLILDHVNQKFTNTTNSGTSFLTGLFDGLWNLLASTPSHSQREYIFTIVPQTSSTLNVYLLNTSNGETKTFTVKNKQDQTIPDATVSISNKINDTFVTVAQGVTNFAGQVNIFLSSTNGYRFTIEAAGFNTKVFPLVPTVDSYNIIMDPTDIVDFTTVFDRVSYTTLPASSILTPSDSQNFSIITSSELGFISYFGLNSSFNSTAGRITNVTGSPAGGTASIFINTTNHTSATISVDFFIKLNGEEEIRFTRTFRTSSFIVPGNHSAQAFADKYRDRFSDVMKALIVVIVAVAVILSLAEMGSPAVINGVAGAVIIIAGAVVGWIPITVAFIVGFITIGMFLLRRGD